MIKFLCLIIDRDTKKTLREYPEIFADGWYSVRRKAANLYAEEIGSWTGNWYVDSLELD